ncbi:hypothetical protein BKA70DRAFT_1253712 [Coprinopsis sp. MPI-PUGE-AT-0042]|nr:hypothetical protein BKA70DRAFT_1253712 [Coprinopsis sp. MPI-PUGE-AT-0042]
MLRTLKARFSKHGDKRRGAASSLQAPNLPFEILFIIIDEYLVEGTPASMRNLTAVGRTCRALASYCRILLFRSTEVRSQSAKERRQDHRKKTPTQFVALARRYPSVLDFIQSLSLCFNQGDSPGRRDRRLADTQRKEWIEILSSSYPQLTVLKLEFPRWSALPRELQESILQMLMQADRLETLVVDILECPLHIVQYCPSTLKHFVYINKTIKAIGFQPIDKPTRDWPNLESFTLAGMSRALSQEHLSSSSPGSIVEYKSLKHIAMWSADGLAVFPVYSPFIHQSSFTLQCLHLFSPGFAYRASDPPLPTLDLGSLWVLRLFEVGVNVWQLAGDTPWISSSIATVPAERVGDLVVVINVQHFAACCIEHPRPPALTQRLHDQAAIWWDNTFESGASHWLGLHSANVFAFSEVITKFGHSAKDEWHLPLQPRIGVNSSFDQHRPYASVVRETCICSRIS